MRLIQRAVAAALMLTGLALVLDHEAASQTRRAYAAGPGHVVAESWWGHGTISAPVRPGPRGGWEVRLPRGTWIDCGRSCAQTLRQQTLDYWESNGPQAKDGGPGYFRWSFGF